MSIPDASSSCWAYVRAVVFAAGAIGSAVCPLPPFAKGAAIITSMCLFAAEGVKIFGPDSLAPRTRGHQLAGVSVSVLLGGFGELAYYSDDVGIQVAGIVAMVAGFFLGIMVTFPETVLPSRCFPPQGGETERLVQQGLP